MIKNTLLVTCLALLVTVCGAQADFLKIDGWQVASEIDSCNTESLWEYINGAAEQYLDYGYQKVTYCDIAAGDLVVTVNLYDMGSPISAFGLYNIQKPSKASAIPVGGEAVILPPYQGLMYKDRFFVMADVYEGEFTAESGQLLMKAIAAALPGSDDQPAQLSRLPQEHKIPGSEGYTPKGFLGMKDLPNCIHADYAFSDKISGKVFIIENDSGAPAIWQTLEKKWTAATVAGSRILTKAIPYQGSVGIIRTEWGLLGLSGPEREADLLKQLKAYVAP